MERRDFLMSAGMLAAASGLGAAPALAARPTGKLLDRNLKGRLLDLNTGPGNRDAWARLLANTDMKSTKYGWAKGKILGVRPGEPVRSLVGFTMLSTAKLLPYENDPKGYRKVLREVGLYTDLNTGEILEEWTNPYLNEKVKVVPIANDPFNHTITEFRPDPPSYGGLNTAKPPKRPLQFEWDRRGNDLSMLSYIHLFYPNALQPSKWPRESGNPFAQVSEMFTYHINWQDIQNPRKTSVEYTGVWNRITPWLPWMLMGPTPGHCVYVCMMGGSDNIEIQDRRTLDYIEKNMPKYLTAPEKWEEPSLSSLEWYAREQKPAPVPAGQPIPRAPDPELPPWFKAMLEKMK
jgi:hypothetical protein